MAVRFMRRGITRFFFVPTIANKNAPTAVEVNAGTELSKQIAEVAGFTFSNSPINTPNFEDTFTPQIPGEDTAAASSLTMYELKGTPADTIRPALVKGTQGFIVAFPEGTAAASPAAVAAADVCDVWPVSISANSKQYTAGNEAARYLVDFSVTDVPAFDKALT